MHEDPSEGMRSRHPDRLFFRLARGSASVFFLHAFNLGLGYLVQVALARWMGAVAYGHYALILAWVSLLAVPAALGLPSLMVRCIPSYHARQAWGYLRGLLAWSRMWVGGASVGAALVATGVFLAVAFPEEDGRSSAWLLGFWLLPLLSYANWMMELCRALHRVILAYVPALIRHLVVLAGAFLLFRRHGSLSSTAAMVVTLLAYVLILAVQVGMVRVLLPARVREAPKAYEPQAWWRISLPLLLVGGFGLLLNQADLILVGGLLGPREAGLYRAASRTAGLVGTILVAASAVAAPHLPALDAMQDRKGMQRLLRTVAAWVFWPSLLVVGVLVAAAGPVLRLFGPAFVEGRAVLVVLALGQLANAGTGMAAEVLNLTGHQRLGASVMGGTILVHVLLVWLGTVWFGMVGAALATAVAVLLMNGVLAWAAYRKLGLDPTVLSVFRRREALP